MSTEHEGGFAGSERPDTTAGDSVEPTPAPDAPTTVEITKPAAVAETAAVGEVADSVVAPVDPELTGFPPPSPSSTPSSASTELPPLPEVPPAPPALAAALALAPYDAYASAPEAGAPADPASGYGADVPGPAYPVWGTVPAEPAPAPRKKGRGGLVAVLVVTALAAGGIGGGIGSWLVSRDGSDGNTSVSASVNPQGLSRSPSSIAGIAAKSLPSVVTISATNSSESGTGTGFIFNSQGYILTNNHVVAPSTSTGGTLTVKFSDGGSYPAKIVGRAEGYDVAVIKIVGTPKEKPTPLPLGNSDDVAVGDTTIAIGAPFGLSGTVTSGIISAKNRPVASGDETGADQSYMNALQTDASINPGNSGGPLMNAEGQVIGIDSAIQSGGSTDAEGQSGSVGLGFAIPINQAEYVAAQLIKTGQPIYPIIGILRDDSYTGSGAKIASAPVQGTAAVTANGPAAQAGLKPGDIITEFGGVLIDSGPTLVSEIWSHHPGDKVSLTYIRNGQTHTTTITLGKRVGDSQ